MKLKIAFSTEDGNTLVNKHAGEARYFDIYRFSQERVEFIERRENPKYKADKTKKHGDPNKAKAVFQEQQDIMVLVSKKFGPNLPRLLTKLLCVVVRTEKLHDAKELIRKNLERVIIELKKGENRSHLVLQ